MLRAEVTYRQEQFQLQADLHMDGDIVGIFGRSGAGKTTLLQLLCGLVRPDEGRVALDGRILFDREQRIDVPPHQRRIGMVFQEDRLLPHLSVRHNLLYGHKRTPVDQRRLALPETVRLLELTPLLDRRVHNLSGGEKQRVALGRALLTSPQLMLLDEPLASLDSTHRAQILPFLRRVRDAAGIPMLYVSHDISEVLQLTDRFVVMQSGRIIGQGRYSEVVDEPDVLTSLEDGQLTNVLTATILETDPATGLQELRLATSQAQECIIHALPRPLPVGGEVRVEILPQDIALSREELMGTSIRNQIPGVIKRIRIHEHRALILIDLGQPVLVRVTEHTVREMKLQVGESVRCLIKAAAVRYLNGAASQA